MKPLKQIREEHFDKVVTKADKEPVFSTTNIPFLLLFRRVSYRMYPNKQVVALYYSQLLDKYLSIPFGPEGNLNLSEARVYDSEEQLNEFLQALVKGAAAKAADIAKRVVKGVKDSSANSKPEVSTTQQTRKTTITKDPEKPKSSWDFSKNKTDAVYRSKLKANSLKPVVAENKISDLRDMILNEKRVIELNISGNPILINTSMAKRILEVYDNVNNRNKKIVENMLNEDLESFKKLLNFSIRK